MLTAIFTWIGGTPTVLIPFGGAGICLFIAGLSGKLMFSFVVGYCFKEGNDLISLHFRHLFIPLMEAGFSRVVATTAVFFISAFFHEFLVSVPLRTFKTWAFMGMMGQVTRIRISSIKNML